MLCYEPILKRLSGYYVILAEVDGHSERTGELVSLEKNCDEIEDYIVDNLSGNLYCLSCLGGVQMSNIQGSVLHY